MEKKITRCSFCGKEVEEVDQIVSGINANICNECIEICHSMIEYQERTKKKERAKMEAELIEQIKLKEDLERKETLKIQKQEKIEEEIIRKKLNNFEKNKKTKKISRKESNKKPLEDKIKNQMNGIVLQKTVTIKKED